MEYLDVLDINGNTTEVKKLRDKIHRDGNWHKAVHVWIINSQGELLIQKRSPKKDAHPNLWDISVAGHVLSGQDSITSGVREIKEELGLSILKNDLEYLFSYKTQTIKRKNYINNAFFDVYLLQKNFNIDKINFQKEEITEIRLIPYRELEKEILNHNSLYLNHVIEYPKLFKILHKRFK